MKKNYKNTFWFTVGHAAKKNFIFPAVTFVLSLYFYLSGFCWDIIKGKKNIAALSGQNLKEMLRNLYEVLIFNSGELGYNPMEAFYPAILVALSALLGVMLFRFVTNKKTVNVYYSLGIKRSELYAARWLAGALMMLAAVLLPLAVSAAINLYYFGSSVALWKTVAFYAVHASVAVLAGLTISAAVSSCVGTVVESIGFSAVLIAFPSIVMMCINYAVPAILHGAPSIMYYGVYPKAFSYGDVCLNMSVTPIGKLLGHIDLLMLNNDEFISSGVVAAMTGEEIKKWSAPSFSPYILWTVLIVLFFAFGLFMFKRRKAEICGFPGRSNVLNFILSMIVSFSAASFALYFAADDGYKTVKIWMVIAGAVVLSYIIFLLIDVLIHLNFKALKKDWKIGFIHVGLMAAFMLSLYSGFFGYSSRLPDIQDIESATVSAPSAIMGSYKLGKNLNSNYYGNYEEYSENLNYYYLWDNTNSLIENFKSKEDIAAVRELHKALIKAGNVRGQNSSADYSERVTTQNVIIKYKLKNGRELIRTYEYVPLNIYTKLYTIEDTENWNNKIKNELLNIDAEAVIPIIFSAQMDTKTVVSEEETKGLARAIYNDIVALSTDKFLSSNAKYLGAVALYDCSSAEDNYESNDIEYTTQMTYDTEIGSEDEEIPLSREEIAASGIWLTETEGVEYASLGGNLSVIPVTEEMTNTIQYLKDHGLYDKLSDTSPIVSVRIADMGKATSDSSSFGPFNNPIFNSFWDNGKSKSEKKTYPDGSYWVSRYTSGAFMPSDSKTITDKEIIEKLSANAYGYRFDLNGGYLVEFKRENGHLTIMYVPAGRVNIDLDSLK